MESELDTLQVTLARTFPGQNVRAWYGTESGASQVDYGLQLALSERPRIFVGRYSPFFWLWSIFSVLSYLGNHQTRWRISAKLPTSTETRAEYLSARHERAHFGDWNSMAGQMLTGLQGFSHYNFDNLIVVTNQELLVVAVSSNEKNAEITFRIPLANIAWTRRPHREKHRIQFGFTDGSWHTPRVEKYRKSEEFMELFPHTLPHTAKIPDVLATPPTEGIGS
ncbi:hypothetical protein ACWEV4_11875 [Streptomyces sp. NPDC003860]